jgi:glycosyltransferase involved in cell wall biosynthesis
MTRRTDVVVARGTAVNPDPRVARVVKALSDWGYSSVVIGWDRERSGSGREQLHGAPVIRVRVGGEYGAGIRNLLALLLWQCWLLCYLVRLRPRVIHSVDLDTVLPCLLVKYLFGTRVVYDIADWYSESRRVGRLAPMIANLERWVCRHVDVVVIAHENRLKQLGRCPVHCVTIYNSPDEIDVQEVAATLEWQEGRYVAYVGVLQPDRGIPFMVEAARRAQCQVVVAGFGPLEAMCSGWAKESQSVQFMGRVPYDCALAIQSKAAAIIAQYDPAIPNNKFAAPNKLFEAMMLGKPLITTEGTQLAECVEREGLGLVVPYGDVSSLAEAIRSLVDNPELAKKMGDRGRRLYEERYRPSVQFAELHKVYDELLLGGN